MFFVNYGTETVVAVIGQEGMDCTSDALGYVIRRLAKSFRSARSMEREASLYLAMALCRALPITDYVKDVYKGKAQTHSGVDAFNVEFGMKLALARARSAYWRDVAHYMNDLAEFAVDFATSFCDRADGTFGTAVRAEERVCDLLVEDVQ